MSRQAAVLMAEREGKQFDAKIESNESQNKSPTRSMEFPMIGMDFLMNFINFFSVCQYLQRKPHIKNTNKNK